MLPRLEGLVQVHPVEHVGDQLLQVEPRCNSHFAAQPASHRAGQLLNVSIVHAVTQTSFVDLILGVEIADPTANLQQRALVERIDSVGRSGHVSESVVRYQNNEMAKADVAFEVLSRYFARQIIDILDATDPGDRELREKEMRGLEQFFGMGIADKAQSGGGAGGIIASAKSKLGMSHDEPEKPAPALGGFPTASAQFPTAGGAAPQAKPKPQDGPTDEAHAKAVSAPRDWSKMLGRVRQDVERICNFLEALAKHPRGLQKYHEEAVRTVHDSWIDREGEQSLRRWVRSECARIWPHKFAAIDSEKERARADIDALEELFGGRSSALPAPGATP